jgi:hypothetical protein
MQASEWEMIIRNVLVGHAKLRDVHAKAGSHSLRLELLGLMLQLFANVVTSVPPISHTVDVVARTGCVATQIASRHLKV